jgi:3-phosphoshikimate 1-carboxyvinyltransferase
MGSFVTQGIRALEGTVKLRGDKSIAHRAVMLAGISLGITTIHNFPIHEDAAATLHVFRSLGIKIKKTKTAVIVYGRGLNGLKPSYKSLSVKESGTTLRLLLGLLAGQNFKVSLIADSSLARRPMRRVTEPLRAMGASIKARKIGREEYAPMTITGGALRAIVYRMPTASAQVKSAILLAGLYAQGITRVVEPVKTRDHTERMLAVFGAPIKRQGNMISIRKPSRLLSPGTVVIPGDISSASFFIVAASLLAGSRLVIRTVSLNPTRIGILNVLRRMGASVKVFWVKASKGGEPFGDIAVCSGVLKAVTIKRNEIPSLIDELPVLMVAACFAAGKTVIKGVEELRVKETDRIKSMTDNLSKMGASIHIVKNRSCEDIVIRGTGGLSGASVKSYGDHRTAMAMVVAGLAAKGKTSIDNIDCVSKSFPDFLQVLKAIMVK